MNMKFFIYSFLIVLVFGGCNWDNLNTSETSGFSKFSEEENEVSQAGTWNFDNGNKPNGLTGNWSVVSGGANNTSKSLKSANIGNNQQTCVQTTRNVSAGNVEFQYKVSSEQNYDELFFYIDSAEKLGGKSGNIGWTQASYAVSAGSHTFKWCYQKDDHVSGGSDAAWIDEVNFPDSYAANKPPEKPSNISTSDVTADSIKVSWTAATDSDGSISGYEVSYKIGNGFWSGTSTTANTTYTFQSLQPATSYTFRIRTKDDDGDWSPYQTSTAVSTAPNAPTSLAVSARSLTFMMTSGNSYECSKDAGTTKTNCNSPFSFGYKAIEADKICVRVKASGNTPASNWHCYDQAIFEKPWTKQWSKLLGSSSSDYGYGVSVDSAGNAYVTGWTKGNFDGHSNSGKSDMFLIKYDSSGNKKWSKLLGTSNSDYGVGVSVDSAGNVYVTGYSEGNFDGHSNSGKSDMFLIKYDSSGNKKWSRLFGSSSNDIGYGVSVDSAGNVYVTGYSEGNFDGHTNSGYSDMFLIKYDSSGNKKWSKLLGSSSGDYGNGVVVDSSGNVYVTGYSEGAFDGHRNSGKSDMFLIKYDSSGNKKWSKLLGSSSDDYGYGVSVDSAGNVYVTGYSEGKFDGHTNSGENDMFLIKYDSSGNKKWSQLLGSSSDDEGKGVSVDSKDNVYVTGYSEGKFDGHTNSGNWDMFLVKYDSLGNKRWSKLLGSSSDDEGKGVSVDSAGNVYVTGYSEGKFDGHTNSGSEDMFLVKYSFASLSLVVSGKELIFDDSSGKNHECSKDGGTSLEDCTSPFPFGNDVIAKDQLCVRVKASGNTPASNWDCYDQAIFGKQWSKLLGSSSHDYGEGVSVDSAGNVYVTGYSGGNFDGHTNSGYSDMFLIKYDSSGNKKWSKLLGSSSGDYGYGVSVDSAGNVYVTGYSGGNFDGHSNSRYDDMFLVKYDSSGVKKWSKLLGTSSYDEGRGVVVDSAGNVYVTGDSGGNFDGKTNPAFEGHVFSEV